MLNHTYEVGELHKKGNDNPYVLLELAERVNNRGQKSGNTIEGSSWGLQGDHNVSGDTIFPSQKGSEKGKDSLIVTRVENPTHIGPNIEMVQDYFACEKQGSQ